MPTISDETKQSIIADRNKCVGILQRFQQRKAEDDRRASTNNDYPVDSQLTEEEKKTHREQYQQELEKLRNDSNDVEVRHRNLIQNVVTEESLHSQKCLEMDGNIRPILLRAHCPECGAELTTDKPKMFNPYTGESLAIHKCPKCGKEYNLEYAYPRIVFVDSNHHIVKAFAGE